MLLAYEAKIIDKNAKILSGVHPYFGVTIKAKLLLFSPKPNMLLGWFSMILIVCEGVSFVIWSLPCFHLENNTSRIKLLIIKLAF